jgi:hypothetical protein
MIFVFESTGAQASKYTCTTMPEKFSSIKKLERLISQPDSLFSMGNGSRVNVGSEILFVIYTSEGSGIINEFAYAYACDASGGCTLFTTAHSRMEAGDELSHSYDLGSGELTFWSGARKVSVASWPVGESQENRGK